MKRKALHTFAVLLMTCAISQAQNITVSIAGDGTAAYTGDGLSSRAAEMNGPKDVCMDAAKNIYFTDHHNGVIRRISSVTGIISTIAGGGSSTADGIPATSAVLSPNYLCISPAGNLYFTTGNQIRKITLATGIITTVAGSATSGYSGDGAAATAALLNMPMGIAVDGTDNVYFVDRGNHAVREVTWYGYINTIAGNGTTGFSGDGGPATAALLRFPAVICINSTGDIYFSDQNPNYPTGYDNSMIRMISASTGIISTVAGEFPGGSTYGVPAINAILGTITGLCCDDSDDVCCNEMSCSCRRYRHHTGMLELIGGNFSVQGYSDGVSSPLANMDHPYGIFVDHAHTVYVADSGNQRIRKLIQLTHTPTFAYGKGQFISTTPLTVTTINDLLTITDMDASQTETWTVLTPPMYGTLAGFPATATSMGVNQIVNPTGTLTYTSSSIGTADQFRILVSDGALTDTITVYVNNVGGITLGVNSVAAQSGTAIFPNPASTELIIAPANWQNQRNNIMITDITDHVLFQGTLDAGKSSTKVDISSFPAGMYLVRINNDETKKFVKE